MVRDYIIIGAGIVGLATAYQLLKKTPGSNLLILEKELDVAKHQTGNNSGVIHSGIYYKPGSLKATNCRKGYKLLLEFCNENDIEYDICGKVIVATNEKELGPLENIYKRGIENGLSGIKKIDENELKEYEQHIAGIAGIHVPQTGIIDYKEVSTKLKERIIEMGGEIKFGESVKNILNGKIVKVETQKDNYDTNYLISCAGLYSDQIASMTEGKINFRIIPFRGEYYKIKPERRNLVNALIYPVPDPAFPFLGVHFTKMIDGEVEAGPNAVFAFKKEGYTKTSFDISDTISSLTWPGFLKVAKKYWRTGLGEYHRSFSKPAFVKALQKLVPEITEEDLSPGGAGVRAQACDKNGNLLDDFHIIANENIFHVCNAPSPAATSSLSIGDYISDKLLSSVN